MTYLCWLANLFCGKEVTIACYLYIHMAVQACRTLYTALRITLLMLESNTLCEIMLQPICKLLPNITEPVGEVAALHPTGSKGTAAALKICQNGNYIAKHFSATTKRAVRLVQLEAP